MAKSVVDMAMEQIDRQIADLNRAKDILAAASGDAYAAEVAAAPKKRGRKRKAGLPAPDVTQVGNF